MAGGSEGRHAGLVRCFDRDAGHIGASLQVVEHVEVSRSLSNVGLTGSSTRWTSPISGSRTITSLPWPLDVRKAWKRWSQPSERRCKTDHMSIRPQVRASRRRGWSIQSDVVIIDTQRAKFVSGSMFSLSISTARRPWEKAKRGRVPSECERFAEKQAEPPCVLPFSGCSSIPIPFSYLKNLETLIEATGSAGQVSSAAFRLTVSEPHQPPSL